MKVAYFSEIGFSDVDISFLMAAKNLMDIDYYAPINKQFHNRAAFNIEKIYSYDGIFRALDIYPLLAPICRLIDEKRFYIVNTTAFHMRSLRNIWSNLRLVWRLRKYDVIHITNFPHYYQAAFYLLRKKIVLTVHDPIPHSSVMCNHPIVLIERKWGFRLLSHFIILNKAQKEECMTKYHLEHKHVYDSRLGRYDYLRMYQMKTPPKNEYFLFFGQIQEHKGIDDLLAAMQIVHGNQPHMRLIIAGKGTYPFDVSEYENLDYIEFCNRFIPDDELAELIQGAYCVICPYKDATQSGVVMSAFAFNKPIIATNVGGLPEQVIDGKYGVIVPRCDRKALANAMDDLVAHPEKLQNFADNIEHDYSEGEKSWKEIAKGLQKVYQEVMNTK